MILQPQEDPRDLMAAVRQLDGRAAEPRAGESRPHGAAAPMRGTVLRTYGIGAQILKDLGVTRMRVLSAPKQLQGLAAFDLEVADYVDGAHGL